MLGIPLEDAASATFQTSDESSLRVYISSRLDSVSWSLCSNAHASMCSCIREYIRFEEAAQVDPGNTLSRKSRLTARMNIGKNNRDFAYERVHSRVQIVCTLFIE